MIINFKIKKMKQKNEPFAIDNNALKIVDRNISTTKTALEKILTAWSKTTNGAPLTMSELVTWYDWHQEFRPLKMDAINKSITRALIGGHQLYNEVTDAALLQMTGKDKHDMTDFITALKLICEYTPWIRWTNLVNRQCFDLRKNEVVVIDSEVERLKAPFIVSATTEGQQTRLKLVRNVIEALEAIVTAYPDAAKRENLSVTGLVNSDAATFTPEPYFVLEGKFASGTGFGGFISARKQPGTPKAETPRATNAPTDPAALAGWNAAQRRNATGVTAAQPGLIL